MASVPAPRAVIETRFGEMEVELLPDKAPGHVKNFLDLARKGRLCFVYRELLADSETPVSVYAKLGRGPYSFLLESVVGGEKWAAYSFAGVRPRSVIRARGEQVGHDRYFLTFCQSVSFGVASQSVTSSPIGWPNLSNATSWTTSWLVPAAKPATQ